MQKVGVRVVALVIALSAVLGGCVRQAAVGGLEVAVSGLPAGTPAAVDVAGPNGYALRLTEGSVVSGLPVGSYTVTAQPVATATATYTATVSGSPATVSAGQTAAVTVTYASGNGGGGGGTGGDITGTVSIVSAAETAADFVPGEVIVKFRPGVRAQALDGLRPLRDLALTGTRLYELSGLSPQSGDAREATLRGVAALAARSDVVYAHPNYLLEPYAEPNDPLYPQQWHLPAINLPAAWDRTTGSAEVTVAVIDSGIVPSHPDLAPKLLPGYDFVGDGAASGDGDGRDGDPTDPAGSFHGSHVAGTVAAATDNGVGVAGVSWGSRLLPTRVLGPDSGTLADAIDGILWSVGESVPGVPENPNPADVLNLSLGGPFLCSDAPAFQDAFDRANAAGATVVVAAGNDDSDASFFTPASCGGVITVGATTLRNERAPYSNYGPRIDIMAPGGNLDEDADGDGFPDGVLSTIFDPTTGENTYAYFQGTSMASPHIAGVAALMKSVRPDLTTAEVRDVLQRTATPLTAASCAEGCGAGLVDAAAALEALSAPVTPDFALSLSPATVSLTGGGNAAVTVFVARSGGFAEEVAFSVSGAPTGLSASFAPPATGGDSTTLTLSAEADLSGTYTLQVQGVGGGVSRAVPLRVVLETSTPEPVADIAGTVVGACYFVNNTCDPTLSRFVQISGSGTSAPYALTGLGATPYFVAAFKDGNNDGDLDDEGDYAGVAPQNGQTGVTPPAAGVDIVMTPRLDTQGLSEAETEALLAFWRSR